MMKENLVLQFIFVDEGIDTGDIIVQKTFPISDEDNYKSLLHKAYEECGPMVLESLRKIQLNDFRRIKQKILVLSRFIV